VAARSLLILLLIHSCTAIGNRCYAVVTSFGGSIPLRLGATIFLPFVHCAPTTATSDKEPNTQGEVELQNNKTDEEMDNGIGVRDI
jgi:hypothetical protein